MRARVRLEVVGSSSAHVHLHIVCGLPLFSFFFGRTGIGWETGTKWGFSTGTNAIFFSSATPSPGSPPASPPFQDSKSIPCLYFMLFCKEPFSTGEPVPVGKPVLSGVSQPVLMPLSPVVQLLLQSLPSPPLHSKILNLYPAITFGKREI